MPLIRILFSDRCVLTNTVTAIAVRSVVPQAKTVSEVSVLKCDKVNYQKAKPLLMKVVV